MKVVTLVGLVLFSACDVEAKDQLAKVTAVVTVDFRVEGRDADGDGTVTDSKWIRDASDDWTQFSTDMEASFGEAAVPRDMNLSKISLSLLDSSQGVQGFGDVFNGPIGYRFKTHGSRAEYSLGFVDIRDESVAKSIDNFTIDFSYERMNASDRLEISTGAFNALFVGQASDDFRRSTRAADMQVVFSFEAIEPEELDAGL